jgi:hypothetical protein
MSTPTHIHHSGGVNTPAGSVPLTLPRRSPRGIASPAKDSAAPVLFAADEKQHAEDDAAAKEKEKGEANKQERRSAASSHRLKQTEVAQPRRRGRRSMQRNHQRTKRRDKPIFLQTRISCCAVHT